MNKNMVKNVAKVALLAGVFGLAGCADSAYFPDTVHNHYKAPTDMTKVPGAENVTVTVVVHNHKKRHDEISRSRDTLNIPFAGVYLNIDKAFKDALDSALEKRGFHIGKQGVNIQVIVQHYDLPMNMFSSGGPKFTGNLDLLVSVAAADYKQNIQIRNMHYEESAMQGFLGPGRTAANKKFMAEGVNKLVESPQFIAALLKAGHAGALVPRLPAG